MPLKVSNVVLFGVVICAYSVAYINNSTASGICRNGSFKRMALVKFPDSLLEKLRCSMCKLYLSKSPVSITQDGQTMCKHCHYRFDDQVVSRCYIYEEIASLYAFPCRYESFGCPQYIQFNQIEKHEDGCMYQTTTCPVAVYSWCDWEDSVFKLSQHYESEHPELVLKEPKFKFSIGKDEEIYRLVTVDGILLLLQTKCVVEEGKMWFNVMYFGNTYHASLIQYKIKLRGEDNKHMMQLENEIPCATTSLQLIPAQSIEVDIKTVLGFLKYPPIIQAQWVITISEEVKTAYKEENQQDRRKVLCITNEIIRCPYCRIFMTPPIFRCCQGHITCIDCKGFDNECVDCQQNNVQFSRAYDLEHLAKSAQFYCKWKNCEKLFSCDEIRIHEQSCTERVYKCPCCEMRIGLLAEVPKHFRQKHDGVQFVEEVSSCRVINLDLNDKDMFIFLQKEFVRLRLVRYNTAGHFYVKVVVSHQIALKISHYFKCEVMNNRKGFGYNFNGSIYPCVVTEHISKEKYGSGLAYFTVRLVINESTWIPFDYPFKNVELSNM